MNVLITGATGFVGKTLLRKIASNPFFSKSTIVLLSGTDIDGYTCIKHNGYTFTKDDFSKADVDRIDAVIHMGSAVPRTRDDYRIENGYKFMTNVRNTVHLYENLPNIPKKFICISSVDVYKNDGEVISEQTPLTSETLYAASKIMCEQYLTEKAKADGFVLQILRFGQIYGIGEEVYSKIVSSFVRQIETGQQIKIFGNGEDFRSQLLVDDCCDCVLKAVSFNESKGPVNLVSDQAVRIKDLVMTIYRIAGKTPDVVFGDVPAGRSNRFDNTKMKTLFQMTETPLEEGVRAYVDYYRREYGKR
ncbi:MAG: NAD(P)-dependent oxidoreductase [Alphaproteobacteria bacterium]|nr:NAD(P)-dependent oxidoreductase [Alphaproteobacteria bacterium]